MTCCKSLSGFFRAREGQYFACVMSVGITVFYAAKFNESIDLLKN